MTDIPTGPCLGLYVLDPASSSSSTKKKTSKEQDDDDDDDDEVHLPPKQMRRCSPPRLRQLGEEETTDDDDDDDDDVPNFRDPDNNGRVNFDALRAAVEQHRLNKRIKMLQHPPKLKQHCRGTSAAAATAAAAAAAISKKKRRCDDDDKSDRRMFIREKRVLNLLDREEGDAIQYLCLGGHRFYITDGEEEEEANRKPDLIASGLHAGPGQLSFGWCHQQRADLTLIFFGRNNAAAAAASSVKQPTKIFVHNHHGSYWHYTGHSPDCSTRIAPGSHHLLQQQQHTLFNGRATSQRQDEFRHGLVSVWNNVAPDCVCFYYSTTTSCQLFHGSDSVPCVPGLHDENELYANATTALLATASDSFLTAKTFATNSPQGLQMSQGDIKAQILAGTLTGFVTLTGGRESRDVKEADPAGSKFGFCVQNYAARPNEISSYTKRQIGAMQNLRTEADIDKFIQDQPPRTLVSGTFHSEETVSTSYLRWLMMERGFDRFSITHLMIYKFADYPKDFLEPVLQARHECKQRGDKVAAECLKLIGNGSFGYNGLESTNYASVRLMTQTNLEKRREKDLAVHTIRHLTCLGVVKVKSKKKKNAQIQSQQQGRRRRQRNEARVFLADQAVEVDDDDDDDDDDNDSGNEFSSSSSSSDEERREMDRVLGIVDDDDDDDELNDKDVYDLQLLFAVEIPGKERRIFNNLPKAVAVLSNSKRLFFSHLNVMFRCLNPRLAELCYVDTDSCIWSFTYTRLEDCLLPERVEEWNAANIIADEAGERSCHGKMKLEGVYKAGLFKTAKIYRLFATKPDEQSYTRCKGINRWIANRLEDVHFDGEFRNKVIVNRTCLRPTRTGEIHLNHESRSLMKPYNLKRRVVGKRGIHTMAFSEPAF